MKKSKFMSLVAVLLMFVVALTCGFLFACNSDKDDDTKDQDIVEENPTEPTEPEETEETEEPEETEDDLVVSAYKGTINFGETYTDENGTVHDEYYADFTNLDGLTVTEGTDENGKTTYSFEGVVPRMTEEQVLAFNVGPDEDGTKDGATTSDGFVVIAIAAEVGYTVDYAGVTEIVGEDGYVTFVQMVRNKGDKEVTIYDESGVETDSFTVVLSGLVIRDYELVGVWSNASIAATATVGTEYSATAAVELTVSEDGTYTLAISNIAVEGLEMDLSSIIGVVTMEGTWIGGEGKYALTGEEGNSVTVTMNEDGGSVQMSIEMTYDALGFMSIPIAVEDETLTAGELDTSVVISTWSATEIEVGLNYSYSDSITITSATMSMELKFKDNGTFILEISDIATNDLDSQPIIGAIVGGILSAMTIDISGTWAETDDGYTVAFDIKEGGSVTVNENGDLALELVTEEDGTSSLKMSFSVTYVNMNIPITVTDAVLTEGALD